MASPLSSCFRLGFSGSRPQDGEVIGKYVQGKPAVVWEADREGVINQQVLPGAAGLHPPAGTREAGKSTFFGVGTTRRRRSSSNLLCPRLRGTSGGIKSSSTLYPLCSALRTFPQSKAAPQATGGKHLRRKPWHIGNLEGAGGFGGAFVSSATTAFREDLGCRTSGQDWEGRRIVFPSMTQRRPLGSVAVRSS